METQQLPVRQRTEFSRETALNRSEPDFPQLHSQGFRARVRGFAGAACELREGLSDPIILRRTPGRCRRDGGDEILLSASVAGRPPQTFQLHADRVGFTPGRILMLDMAHSFAVQSGGYREINFRLPRSAVTQVLGADPGRLGGGMLLPETGLTKLLFDQLVGLADHLPDMSDEARAVAMQATADFALATMRVECTAAMPAPDAEASDWMWHAARRCIASRLGDPDLSADSIARVLRCSRAHLYRLFARHGHTVMDYIRRQRLERSQALLSDPACRLQIAEIAF